MKIILLRNEFRLAYMEKKIKSRTKTVVFHNIYYGRKSNGEDEMLCALLDEMNKLFHKIFL